MLHFHMVLGFEHDFSSEVILQGTASSVALCCQHSFLGDHAVLLSSNKGADLNRGQCIKILIRIWPSESLDEI